MQVVDHYTAHLEMPADMLVHYLLGRQIALEQVLRTLLKALPADQLEESVAFLGAESEAAMQRVNTAGSKAGSSAVHASDCGYACGLIQMGF